MVHPGGRHWLWVMTNPLVAYFQIHPTRSQAAFEQLTTDWRGILVSDDYGVYQSWTGLRQTCLAQVIRTAQGLAEYLESGIAAFGSKIREELQRLCHMTTVRPTVRQWRAWSARFRHLIASTTARGGKVRVFCPSLVKPSLAYPSSSFSNACASCRSVVSNPSVNQL